MQLSLTRKGSMVRRRRVVDAKCVSESPTQSGSRLRGSCMAQTHPKREEKKRSLQFQPQANTDRNSRKRWRLMQIRGEVGRPNIRRGRQISFERAPDQLTQVTLTLARFKLPGRRVAQRLSPVQPPQHRKGMDKWNCLGKGVG
jgi:hypothetical protein